MQRTRMPRLPLVMALTLFVTTTAQADFQSCVTDLREQAQQEGISDSMTEQVFAGMEPLERVIELDRRQPEFTASFANYLGRRVTSERVEQGRELLEEHRELLESITRETGVPPHYLLAFWGMETNFGSYFGRMPIPDALTTLACDERRSDYFTGELMNALKILDRGDIEPERMKGSWAGAMGHMQFMPSVYLRHAVDADGSGRVDLWESIPDAMTSAGNFLEDLGWNRGERWGREILLPEGFDYHVAQGRNEKRTLSEWRDMGLTDAFGNPLPDLDMEAALLLPSGHEGPAFVVYDNFHVIMGWNRSEFYALAVGHLADRIAGGGELQRTPPDHEPLSLDTVEQMQKQLNERGFDAGPEDGVLGPSTRSGLRAFQQSEGLRADGYPDPDSLERLGLERSN